MSQEAIQFVEMVRQAYAQLVKEPVHYLHCQMCGGRTAHKMVARGLWEYYTCQACGCKQSYKVK
jgi:ribosomal protein L37AE/L43A